MTESISVFDARILETLFAIRDPNLVQMFIWVTELGRAWLVYAIGIVVVLLLISKRCVAYATGLCISLATSSIAILVIKGLVERPRPPEAFQAYLEVWYSFPSAHAAFAFALYGFLALLTWRLVKHRIVRYIALFAFIGVSLLVSLSRMYLGVHYASDVLVGIALGSVCVWLGWKYAKIARNGNS